MLTSSLIADAYLFGIVALITWHAWACARRGRMLVLDPLNAFWGGVLICYVWQPYSHFETVVSWRGLDVVENTLLMCLLAVAGLIGGYESRVGTRLTRYIPSLPPQLNSRRMAVTALILIGLGLAGYGYLVATAGSLSAWLAVGRGGTKWENLSGYVTEFHNLLPLGIGLLLFRAEFHRVSRSDKVIAWSLGATQWLWFVYLGTRSRTIAFALVMLAAYLLPRRRNPPLVALPLMAAGMLVVVQFQAAYRNQFTNLSIVGNLDMAEVQRSAPEWIVSGASRSDVGPGLEFNCAAAVVELVPSVVDYNYGYTHLDLLTRAIPRSLWPDKIYPTYQAYTPIFRAARLSTTVIPTAKEYLLMGPSLTFVGHWYSVGGVIAVIVASILTGMGLRAVRGIYDRDPGNESDMVLFATLLPFAFNECSGEPLFFVFSLPFSLGPLLLMMWFCRERAQPS